MGIPSLCVITCTEVIWDILTNIVMTWVSSGDFIDFKKESSIRHSCLNKTNRHPGTHTTAVTVWTKAANMCSWLFWSPAFFPSPSLLSCLGALDQIITVSADFESGMHMWSTSFCLRLSKHFRSHKLFLLQKARRLKSQKACYGGILYVFSPPSLFTAGERFSPLPDDNACNVTRDSHLFQTSYNLDLLPLYCWGIYRDFKSQLTQSSRCFLGHKRAEDQVTTAPGLLVQKGGCDKVDVSGAEHEAAIQGYM